MTIEKSNYIHMKFKIGDLVRFVDEPIEGHVTSFQDNDIVGVTDETGFEIPVLTSKITLVHGNMNREDDEVTETKIIEPAKFVEKGILLAVSGDQKEGLAKLHIINETSYELLVSVSEISNAKAKGIFAGMVSPHDAVQFFSGNFSAVGNWPNFHFQIIKHSRSAQKINQPIEKEQRVRPVDLTNAKLMNDTLREKVWHYVLDKEEENIGLDKLQSHFISNRPQKK